MPTDRPSNSYPPRQLTPTLLRHIQPHPAGLHTHTRTRSSSFPLSLLISLSPPASSPSSWIPLPRSLKPDRTSPHLVTLRSPHPASFPTVARTEVAVPIKLTWRRRPAPCGVIPPLSPSLTQPVGSRGYFSPFVSPPFTRALTLNVPHVHLNISPTDRLLQGGNTHTQTHGETCARGD